MRKSEFHGPSPACCLRLQCKHEPGHQETGSLQMQGPKRASTTTCRAKHMQGVSSSLTKSSNAYQIEWVKKTHWSKAWHPQVHVSGVIPHSGVWSMGNSGLDSFGFRDVLIVPHIITMHDP